MIHKVCFEQIDVVHAFLTYFVKPEKLVGVTSGKKIKRLEINKSDILPTKMLFVGTGAREIILKFGEKKRNCFIFLSEAEKVLPCMCKIQKLSLGIKVFISIAFINRGMIVTDSKSVIKYLINLHLLIQILKESRIEMHDVEVKEIMFNSTVPLPVQL